MIHTLRSHSDDVVVFPNVAAKRQPSELRMIHDIGRSTTVRLKVEENQLVDVFGEIGTRFEGLKSA